MVGEIGELELIRVQLDRIEGKLDALFALRQMQHPVDRAEARKIIGRFTMKQHAVAQMMLQGVVDHVMGTRMGVTRNTIKLHRAAISHKLDVTTHVEAMRRLQKLMDALDPAEYVALSGGLPKTWASTYVEPDPYADLYRRRE